MNDEKLGLSLLILRLVLISIIFVFSCVGTGVHWFQFDPDSGLGNGAEKVKYFLYGYKIGNSDLENYGDAGLCRGFTSRMDAAFSFGIASCVSSVACLVLTFALCAPIERNGVFRFGSVCLSFTTFATTLVCWALGTSIYHHGFCGLASVRENGGEIVGGYALIVTAWVLTVFDAALSVYTICVADFHDNDDEPNPHKLRDVRIEGEKFDD